MIARQITYKKIPEAIKAAFTEDKAAFEMHDPNVKVETVDDIVNDIVGKLKGWDDGNLFYFGVFEKGELVGYFAYRNRMLVSFALAPKLRVRSYLKEFFSLIRKEFNGKFECMLFNRNIRGLKWLTKMGMKAAGGTDLITRLIYF